jgi:TonB family protein
MYREAWMGIVPAFIFIVYNINSAQEFHDSVEVDTMYDSLLVEKLENLELVTEPCWYTDSSGIPNVPYHKLDVKPQVIEYPKIKRIPEIGQDYVVVVKMLIDSDGEVVDSKLIRTSGSTQLDSIVLDAVLDYRFTPPKYKGRCVRTWVSAPYRFVMEK